MGLQLTPGHIHQHEDWNQSRITILWPAPNGRWHVGVNGYPPHATEDPVSEQEVYRLFHEWGIEVEGWITWRGRIEPTNPAWEMGIGRVLRGERIV